MLLIQLLAGENLRCKQRWQSARVELNPIVGDTELIGKHSAGEADLARGAAFRAWAPILLFGEFGRTGAPPVVTCWKMETRHSQTAGV